ncbi:cation efflux family-domain-containing protein [Limtongia smithiae]|uniref:cation efflux family-domain-containing protein n=1 Tax=Limtongia smithiae TaxID=1125753 RepID=UPI0034CE6301
MARMAKMVRARARRARGSPRRTARSGMDGGGRGGGDRRKNGGNRDREGAGGGADAQHASKLFTFNSCRTPSVAGLQQSMDSSVADYFRSGSSAVYKDEVDDDIYADAYVYAAAPTDDDADDDDDDYASDASASLLLAAAGHRRGKVVAAQSIVTTPSTEGTTLVSTDDDDDEEVPVFNSYSRRASRTHLSRLYRSKSWGAGAMALLQPISSHKSVSPAEPLRPAFSRSGSTARLSVATQTLVSSFIAASNAHHHRTKSSADYSAATTAAAAALALLPSLHDLRAQYLIGSTRSPYDWERLRVPEQRLRGMSGRMRKFHQRQNELIDRYIEIDCLLDSDISHSMIRQYGERTEPRGRSAVPANIDEEGQVYLNADAREEYSGIVTLAIMVNLLINVFLLSGKTVIVLLTNSISVIASLVDSALDFLCTSIIWLSTSMVESTDSKVHFKYPVGRARLEPLGVLIFSIIIIVSFIQVAVEAIQRLYSGPRDPVELTLPSFAIMATAVVLKLFAWLWCRSVNSSAVQALAQDAMSDIVFNLLSILFPVAGYVMGFWWLDPLGALLLSVYIIQQWVDTSFEHVRHLTGVSGNAVDTQVVTYLCMRFAESIKNVTMVSVYHSGDRLHVEVDVVADPQLTLRDTHDLGEALQYAIETLPMVERAYVHMDYREDNFAGHIRR